MNVPTILASIDNLLPQANPMYRSSHLGSSGMQGAGLSCIDLTCYLQGGVFYASTVPLSQGPLFDYLGYARAQLDRPRHCTVRYHEPSRFLHRGTHQKISLETQQSPARYPPPGGEATSCRGSTDTAELGNLPFAEHVTASRHDYQNQDQKRLGHCV